MCVEVLAIFVVVIELGSTPLEQVSEASTPKVCAGPWAAVKLPVTLRVCPRADHAKHNRMRNKTVRFIETP
jgi:hypothetical protein